MRPAEADTDLYGLQVYVAEPFKSKDAIMHLILASGAKLLKRAPAEIAGSSIEECRTVVLHEDARPADKKLPGKTSCPTIASASIAHVSYKWLTDSAGAFTIQPLSQYAVTAGE